MKLGHNVYYYQVSSLRKPETPLLVSYVTPHKGITAKTIARWLTQLLRLAGVDTESFSQHSTRSASADYLRVERGLTAKAICQLADWSESSGIYEHFYKRYVI